MKHYLRTVLVVFGLLAAFTRGLAAETAPATPAREIIARAITTEKTLEKREILGTLIGRAEPEIPLLLEAWRNEAIFLVREDGAAPIPVQLQGDPDSTTPLAALRVIDGKPLLDAAGNPRTFVPADLSKAGLSTTIKSAMKPVFDALALADPNIAKRLAAIEASGKSRAPEKLPALEKRLAAETVPEVLDALRKAVALVKLKHPDDAKQIEALQYLREHPSRDTIDFVRETLTAAEAAKKPAIIETAQRSLYAAERHLSAVTFVATLFRGVSAGSILLVVAVGLAISFGLMGVINMAHGEMIAIGAYTTYIVQNFFAGGTTMPAFGLSIPVPGLRMGDAGKDIAFLVALPLSFLAAAALGVLLERSVIRFLYRRPLDSLLATWGVSLILQQTFRLWFGPNNVNVDQPRFLSGSWTLFDVDFAWTRLFVLAFGIVIVIGIVLVLTRTPLGLLMRAVTQNRTMASCMGVRTDRVNIMTFALGSGLAGLAGAFISQIDNVGPQLGQTYIVDSFMVVVLGGVGSIVGTVISAVGIGTVDNLFQQYVPTWAPSFGGVPGIGNFLQNLGQDSAVFGKIFVLGCIILFLQWRPAGLFVTRSRSLEG